MDDVVIVKVLEWLGITIAGNMVSKGSDVVLNKIKETFSKAFKEKFGTVEESEEFIEKIYEDKSKSPQKPKRDIEDIFERITGSEPSGEVLNEIIEWIKANSQALKEGLDLKETQSEINIGSQKAQRDIINIQGNLTINNN